MDHLDKLIEKLNPREKEILNYKCLQNDTLSFDEISAKIGVSRERVRQIYFKSLRKIRKQMIDEWNKNHKNKIEKKNIFWGIDYNKWEDYQKVWDNNENDYKNKCRNIIRYFLNGISTEENIKKEEI